MLLHARRRARKQTSEAKLSAISLHEAFRKALDENKSSDIELEFRARENRKFDVHIAPIRVKNRRRNRRFYDITQIERLETVRTGISLKHLARASHASDFDLALSELWKTARLTIVKIINAF